MVRISMDPFVREFQPDKYELWRAGLEVGTHPENELSKLYSRPRHTAARPAKLPQPQLPAQQTHKYDAVLNSRHQHLSIPYLS